jgi:hypothetical protein
MINVPDKHCRENQTTHFTFRDVFIPKKNDFYEIMWKNIVEPDRPQATIWRMRNAACISQVTNTHSECVILIAFTLQQWLHKRASVL